MKKIILLLASTLALQTLADEIVIATSEDLTKFDTQLAQQQKAQQVNQGSEKQIANQIQNKNKVNQAEGQGKEYQYQTKNQLKIRNGYSNSDIEKFVNDEEKNLKQQQKKDASAKLIQQRLQDREKTKEQQRISGQGGSADGSGSMIRTGGSQSGSGSQNGPRRR